MSSAIKTLRQSLLIIELAIAMVCSHDAIADVSDPPNGLTGTFGESAGAAQVGSGSGDMGYTVPFDLPAARGNSQPTLALQYASGAGTGEAGLGWSLSLTRIERAPLSGWPKYIDDGQPANEDRYTYNGRALTFICTVGGEPTCPLNDEVGPMPSWAEGYRHYRLQLEGTFERFFLSPNRQTWVVQRRGGEILELGAPLARALLTEPALDVEAGAGVFRWYLVRQHDLHGTRNLVVYKWAGNLFERRFLTDIYYTPPAVGGELALLDAFAYHVELSWELPPFRVKSYTKMEKLPLSRRLRRVAVSSKTWTNEGERELVRTYKLGYFPERAVSANPGEAPLWARSSLKQVQMEGRCGIVEAGGHVPDPTGCPSLPPMTFEYRAAELAFGEATLSPLSEALLGGAAVGNGGLQNVVNTAVIDVNHDGLPDIVQAWQQNFKAGPVKVTHPGCSQAGATFIVRAKENLCHDPDGDGIFNCTLQGADPQLACNAIPAISLGSAREQIAYLNRGATATGSLTLAHHCLDAGNGSPKTVTGYHVIAEGLGSALARNTALFTQFSAESIGEWGNASMLWSIAGYRGFSVDGTEDDPPEAATAFCPNQNGILPKRYPALRWQQVDDSVIWSKYPFHGINTKYKTMVDIDGDGYADLLADPPQQGNENFFERAAVKFSRKLSRLESVNGIAGPALVPFATSESTAVTIAPKLQDFTTYVDINGDGIVDLVTASPFIDGGNLHVRPGDGRGGFGCDLATDIACQVLGNGSWLGRAYRLTFPDAAKPFPLQTYVPYVGGANYTYFFHDVTGDGLADIIAYQPQQDPSDPTSVGHVKLWVNTDGRTFRCANSTDCVVATIKGTEQPIAAVPAYRVVFTDIDGNGTEDFVLLGQHGVWHFSFLNVAPVPPVGPRAPRPGLLTRIRNGVGAETEIVYETIQELAPRFKDPDPTSFFRPWTTQSPLVVPVVTRIATRDSRAVGGSAPVEPYTVDRTTRFEYRDPAYDPWEKSFKGFGRVRKINPSGEAEQTWFWFGDCASGGTISINCAKGSDESPDKGLIGAAVRVDRFKPAAVGRPVLWLSTATMRFDRDSNYIAPPDMTPDRTVSFSRLAQTDTFLYDTALNVSQVDATGHPTNRQAAPDQGGAEAHVRSATEYDGAGNTKLFTRFGRLTRNEDPIDTVIRTVVTSLCRADWACLASDTKLIEHRPGETFDRPLKHSELGYNANADMVDVWSDLTYPQSERAALGRNLALGTGAPTSATTLAGKKHLRTSSVDDFGNVISIRGQSAPVSCTKIKFDGPFQQFPESVTQHAGTACTGLALTTQHTFDRGLAAPLANTYPNKTMEKVEYDAFGRPSAVFAPAPDQGPLATELAQTISYHSQSPTSWIEVKTRVDIDAFLSSIEVFNGVGEKILGFDQADPVADGAPWILRDWTERDDDGLVKGHLRPSFFSGNPIDVGNNAPKLTPSGTRFSNFYDPFGRPSLSFDGTRPVSRYVYRPLELRMQDAEQLKTQGPFAGLESVVKKDGHGRTIETQVPAERDWTITRTKYLGSGEPIEIQRYLGTGGPLVIQHSGQDDPNAYVRSIQWDSFGRMIHNFEPNTSGTGVTRGWHYVYDNDGKLVGTSDSRGCGKNLFYDALGRLLAEDFSPCRADQPAYTPPNLSTGDGTEAFYAYDSYEAGQLAPTAAFPDRSEFAIGQLVSVRDRGAYTRFSYDARGRTRRITKRISRPGAVAAALVDRYTEHLFQQEASYDLGDRLRRRTTGLEGEEFGTSGSFETLTFDSGGTLRTLGSSYGNLMTDLQYSATGQLLHSKYGDLAGTQASMGYDPFNRLLKSRVSRLAPPALWSGPPLPSYSRPDRDTTPLTLTNLELSYDDVGNLTTINDSSADPWREGSRPVSKSFQYDAAYRLKQADYAHQHDLHVPVYRPEALAGDRRPIAEAQGVRRVERQTFRSDWQGNVVESRDNEELRFDRSLGAIVNGTAASGTPHGPNQLIDADGIHAEYDNAGNLIELTVARQRCADRMPSCTHRFRYDWDEVGQMSRAQRWDFAAGNVPLFDPTAAPLWSLSYAYSDGGRTRTSVTDAGEVRHTLDVFDTLRIAQTEFRAVNQDYRVLPQNQVGFIGGIARVFFDRDQRLPMAGATPLHVYFNIPDYLGSSSFVVDKDSSEVVERTSYQAYGATEADFRPNRWGPPREPFKLTGKEEDIELGVTYFGARYYNARLGRWMSADPLAVHALSGDLNAYAYVGGQVTTHVDPTGLGEQPIDEVVVHGPPRGSAERSAELASMAAARGEAMSLQERNKQLVNQLLVQIAIQQVPQALAGQTPKKVLKGAPPRPPWSWRAFGAGAWNGTLPLMYGPGNPMGQMVGLLAVKPVDNDGYDVGRVAPLVVSTVAGPYVLGRLSAARAAESIAVSAEGGSAGAMSVFQRMLNWSPKSVPTWGHTFSRHGQGIRGLRSLIGRAAESGSQQGQWLDNEAAADFLSAERNYIQGPTAVSLPPNVGAQVILPNGTTVPAFHALLRPAPGGGYITAFPFIP